MPWITIVSFLKPSWNDAVSTTLSSIKSPSKTSELNNCNTSNPWRWQQWEIDEKNWMKNEYSNFKTPDVDINFSFLQSGFYSLSSLPLFVIETFELYMSFNLFWINIMGMVLLPHPPLSSLVYSLLCQVQTPAGSCWDVLEHWPQHCAQHPLPARQSPGASGRTCLYTYDKILWSSVLNFLIIHLILSFSTISCNWSHFAESPRKLLISKNLPSKPLTGLKSSTTWSVWHNFSSGTTFLFYNFFIFLI